MAAIVLSMLIDLVFLKNTTNKSTFIKVRFLIYYKIAFNCLVNGYSVNSVNGRKNRPGSLVKVAIPLLKPELLEGTASYTSQNAVKASLGLKGKIKSTVEGPSPFYELRVGLYSGSYLPAVVTI